MNTVYEVNNGSARQSLVSGKSIEHVDTGHQTYQRLTKEDDSITLVGVGLTVVPNSTFTQELIRVNSANQSELEAWKEELGEDVVASKLSVTTFETYNGQDIVGSILNNRAEGNLVEIL